MGTDMDFNRTPQAEKPSIISAEFPESRELILLSIHVSAHRQPDLE